jgi:hypothetical protein
MRVPGKKQAAPRRAAETGWACTDELSSAKPNPIAATAPTNSFEPASKLRRDVISVALLAATSKELPPTHAKVSMLISQTRGLRRKASDLVRRRTVSKQIYLYGKLKDLRRGIKRQTTT